MKAYVFVGPTIAADEARVVLDAVYLPPAAQGDVYLVARTRPRAIGIIDGFFDHVPAVWHKEILWALAQGIEVFGSSSMGALRAAELSDFGMVGVGRVFEWYRDGAIDADDEVAVIHGPAELGYAAASEPLVNMRSTLSHAERNGIVSAPTAATLVAIAKGLYYADRTYAKVLAAGRRAGIAPGELDELEEWLPSGRIDQKKLDAVELLTAVRERLATPQSASTPSRTFERTVFWQRLERSVAASTIDKNGGTTGVALSALLDELRLDPASYARARDAAILRELLLAEADRQDLEPGDEAIARAERDFRARHHLEGEADLERWLRDNRVTRAELDHLLREEARLRLARSKLIVRALTRLPDDLRMRGRLAALVENALYKERMLAGRGGELPKPEELGMSLEQVVEWYFQRVQPPRPGESVAECVAALSEVGDDLPALVRAALRQLCLEQLMAEKHASAPLSEP
jgi:hypothetical protein